MEKKWAEINKIFCENRLDFDKFITLVKETAYFLSDYRLGMLSSDVVSLLLQIREMCFNTNIDTEAVIVKSIAYTLSDINNFFGLVKNDNDIILIISTIYEIYEIEIESLNLEEIQEIFCINLFVNN